MPTHRIAIVAAMEREVGPLMRAWATTSLEHQGRRFQALAKEHAVLVLGGIGPVAAANAAEAVLAHSGASLVVSAGFAGALHPETNVGDLVVPEVVVDAASGLRYPTSGGSGALVSTWEVLGPAEKIELAARYHAVALDMEAAAVAAVARARGTEFCAAKTISDEQGFAMPPVGRFVDAAGRFQTARFLAHAALRPRLWTSVGQLAVNTARASEILCESLEAFIANGQWAGFTSIKETLPARSHAEGMAGGK